MFGAEILSSDFPNFAMISFHFFFFEFEFRNVLGWMSEGYVAGWLGQALRVSADELPTPVKGFSHIVSVLSVNEFSRAAVAIFPSMLPGCKSCRQMSFSLVVCRLILIGIGLRPLGGGLPYNRVCLSLTLCSACSYGHNPTLIVCIS